MLTRPIRAHARWIIVLPALALALSSLGPTASRASAAATPSPTPTHGLRVDLDGNAPVLTPGGDPAEFVVTVANTLPRRLQGVRLGFSTEPSTPASGARWYGAGDLRLDVSTGAGWQPAPLTAIPATTGYQATLGPSSGLSVAPNHTRQLRFRIALAATAENVPGASVFTVQATSADGKVAASAKRDYTGRPDPSTTPIGNRVVPNPSDWPGRPGPHRHHHLARAGSATTATIAIVVAVAAVLGVSGVVFGLGTRRRRRTSGPA